MSIGALLYLEISLAQRLKLNWTTWLNEETPPDLSVSEVSKLNLVDVDLWLKPTITTPIGDKKYVVFHIAPIGGQKNEDGTLVWLEHFKDNIIQDLATGVGGIGTIPTNEIKWWGGVVGAWNRDGTQYGTTTVPATYDFDGNEVTPSSITGTPIYAINPNILKFMPDDVTYDSEGNETSRTPALAPKEVNKLLGWGDRIWA